MYQQLSLCQFELSSEKACCYVTRQAPHQKTKSQNAVCTHHLLLVPLSFQKLPFSSSLPFHFFLYHLTFSSLTQSPSLSLARISLSAALSQEVMLIRRMAFFFFKGSSKTYLEERQNKSKPLHKQQNLHKKAHEPKLEQTLKTWLVPPSKQHFLLKLDQFWLIYMTDYCFYALSLCISHWFEKGDDVIGPVSLFMSQPSGKKPASEYEWLLPGAQGQNRNELCMPSIQDLVR